MIYIQNSFIVHLILYILLFSEVRGTLVFEHILEEPPDFNEVQEDHISVSQQASIDQGNKPEAHNSDKGTANGDMSNATKGKTERADKT